MASRSGRSYTGRTAAADVSEAMSDGLLREPNTGQGTPIPVENIHVEAPSDLPGGYQMEVEVDGQPGPVLITIPKGGVQEGQFFIPSAATLMTGDEGGGGGYSIKENPHNIPVGYWRDRFFQDCCKFGICHITVWQSCCCPLLAVAQVITRLQLSWWGTPGSNVAQVAIAFQILIMMLVGFWCMRIFIVLVIAYLDPNADPATIVYVDPAPSYFFFAALDDILFYVYVAFTIVIIRNVRSHLRQKYAIPETENSCTPGCEDVCCSLMCPCFAVSQMLRHTADYDAYTATCCSRTGLHKDAPGIV